MDTKSITNFRSSIRYQVRRLWLGLESPFAFVDGMTGVITRYFKEAWLAGAKECGITEADLTPKEKRALDEITNAQFIFLFGYADAIEAGSKANGGLLRDVYSRAELWVNQYNNVRTKAQLMACSNKPLEWVQGPTKEPCKTCTRLNGIVKRASFWQSRGLQPQNAPNELLDCGGWKCQCRLVVTKKTVTRGRMPKVP